MALELESGVPDIDAFVERRRGKAPIHFGASASHEAARVSAWDLPLPESTFGPAAAIPDPASGPATDAPASSAQMERILTFLRAQLEAGALGVGVGLEYTPGATRHEIVQVFQLAAEYGRPVFVHVRSGGTTEPGSSVESVLEVISASAVTGALAHIVHINSSCLRQWPLCLELIAGARKRGLDVTTEAYPYGVGMTFINSAMFNPGWRERRGIDYKDLEIPETGERLDRDQFERLHASARPQLVLVHNVPDSVVDELLRHPQVMVASDGIAGHPRNAATFARVLARQLRLQGNLTLIETIRKLSLMPAQRLEASTPEARRKGRLKEGADADIVVLDLNLIEDRATFRDPNAPSTGVKYLLVDGMLVVEDGKIIEDAVPGKAFLATPRNRSKS
jgi:N-acyl-D-aspartate/D-glutamate deacylase